VKPALKLHGRIASTRFAEPAVLRLSDGASSMQMRAAEMLWLPSAVPEATPDGFAAVGAVGGPPVVPDSAIGVGMPADLAYLLPGDIVRIHPSAGTVNVLYRRQSRFNALLVTEQCNSNCVMCSQPPKAIDDGFLVDELLRAIPLMAPDTPEIGITGGEPTLLHQRLLELLGALKTHLPATPVHMLTNGRLFAYLTYARQLAALELPDLMVAVPLYADLPWRHDFVVQARGAFDQTIRGLLNLARVGVRVEIRVVLHRQTVERLPQLGRFIARNLPFADHVALMGLELMGHVRMNLDALWIDPLDYQDQLQACVSALLRGGVRPVIYNHQLCVVRESLRPYAVRSISDWKNMYVPECEACALKAECGGFFASSSLRRSRGIHPLLPGAAQAV
jgi:His-Xaa-Ser system radical SAM maturase HxsC